MSIKKFKVLNIRYLPLGLSDAVGLSELVLDAHTKISTKRRFFRQELNHPRYGRQQLDYYPRERTVVVECLDVISFVDVLEKTGLAGEKRCVPQAIFEEALRQAAVEEEIWRQELGEFWKAPS
ncbi:MAG: hypothetical protein HYW15_02025 [Candidatus Giovannonibacteria bacterium]|nr:MAG: hypothetical protein HYW15_02025 [Candidatus Giovannonibacteria bacterium]